MLSVMLRHSYTCVRWPAITSGTHMMYMFGEKKMKTLQKHLIMLLFTCIKIFFVENFPKCIFLSMFPYFSWNSIHFLYCRGLQTHMARMALTGQMVDFSSPQPHSEMFKICQIQWNALCTATATFATVSFSWDIQWTTALGQSSGWVSQPSKSAVRKH